MAEAQIIAGPGLGKNPQQEAKPALPPPPSLPGAQDNGRAAPSDKIPTDMLPTDALFDAIDRGDIASARDAINRGADLNGHN
ncbi:MAG: ankyrin repeat domain-containing protein, partial [Acetobacteraceae bacterium]|nr:ankyrin repeat domain-containing protein [Acetobacteraceae bacterium]